MKNLNITFHDYFLDNKTVSFGIKKYKDLTDSEKESFWKLLESLYDFVPIDGKNKPSTIIEGKKEGELYSKPLELPYTGVFDSTLMWHIHLAPFNKMKVIKTNPILHKNIEGSTSDLMMHYSRYEDNSGIYIVIIGLSHHKAWSSLFDIVE